MNDVQELYQTDLPTATEILRAQILAAELQAAEPGVAAAAVTMRPLADIEQLVAFITPSQDRPPRAPGHPPRPAASAACS